MKHRTRALFGAVFGLLLFQSGASLASTNGCHNISITDCFSLDSSMEDVCCADVDGQLRVATCTRDLIDCSDGNGGWTETWGNGYNCHDIGDPCQ